MMSFFPLKTVVPEIFFTQMRPTLASVLVFKHFQKNFLIKLKKLSKLSKSKRIANTSNFGQRNKP